MLHVGDKRWRIEIGEGNRDLIRLTGGPQYRPLGGTSMDFPTEIRVGRKDDGSPMDWMISEELSVDTFSSVVGGVRDGIGEKSSATKRTGRPHPAHLMSLSYDLSHRHLLHFSCDRSIETCFLPGRNATLLHERLACRNRSFPYDRL